MPKAIRFHSYGGPDVLRLEDVPSSNPAPNQVLIRQTAVGVNYMDIYFRNGFYKSASLPATIGMEAAGVVVELGSEVGTLSVGDRVAYAAGPIGAYATERVIAADRVVRIPPGISDQTAAAMMLQGLTAEYLLHRTFKAESGDIVLVHAAAGGVGLLLCQWARKLGCVVIGVVSNDDKAELARQNGATHTIVGTSDLATRVKRITGGAMAAVVYDGIGRDTFAASIECLAPLGMMVSFGNASGPVPLVDLAMLSAKGSLFITRPSLATYTAKRSDLERASKALFAVVESGEVVISINQTYPLQDAAEAHRLLEARQTTGSTILIP